MTSSCSARVSAMACCSSWCSWNSWLRARNIAILITDHSVEATLRIADRSYILDEGKVIAEGDSRSIIENEVVKRVYLGSRFETGITREEEKGLELD